MRSTLQWTAAAFVLALAGGCATHQSQPVYPQQTGYYQGTQYGVVQSIDRVRAQSQTSGGGALLGGAVGALIGHNISHGSEKMVATGVGVVAGAMIGNEIERNNKGYQDVYRVTVRTDRGDMRAFDYASLNDLRVGDRVRIENNQLYR